MYSLALTLYESVTGRVPFAGDTTVATLMARVGAVLPPARELGPLAPVLAQAAISEPLARLDAAALASELEMLLPGARSSRAASARKDRPRAAELAARTPSGTRPSASGRGGRRHDQAACPLSPDPAAPGPGARRTGPAGAGAARPRL